MNKHFNSIEHLVDLNNLQVINKSEIMEERQNVVRFRIVYVK